MAQIYMSYLVPPDTKEKEKIIGGVLNIAQTMWLGLGLGIAILVFVISFLITQSKISLFIAFPFLFAGVPMIIPMKSGLTRFEYLKRKRKFKKVNKFLPNVRKGGKL